MVCSAIAIALALKLSFALMWALPGAPAAPQTLHGRGVYYADGGQQCPLPGVGARASNACLRVALDDDASTVVVDPATHRIVFRNGQRYPRPQVIGDVLLLGWGRDAGGQRAPVAVHLVVRKDGDAFQARAHAHVVTRAPPQAIDLAPYQVTVSDGAHDSAALDPAQARAAVADPVAAARAAGEPAQVKDDLAAAARGRRDDRRIAAVTVTGGGGGAPPAGMRAEMMLTSGARPPGVPDLLRAVDWELRVQAVSRAVPKEVVRRELFLYGLEGLPILAEVERRGLARGERLVFSMSRGNGRLTYGKRSAELPRAADVARAFLEMSFIGAILEHQAERTLAAPPDGKENR